MPGSPEGMTASQPANGQPDAYDESVPFDGFRRIVGARRKEPAGASKIR